MNETSEKVEVNKSQLHVEKDSKHNRSMNTSELDPETLRKLVENNKELLEEDCSNIDHEIKEEENNLKVEENSEEKSEEKPLIINKEVVEVIQQDKKEEKINPTVANNLNNLISEIEEKDNIIKLLKTSNLDLQEKITHATNEYNIIMARLKQKSVEEDETSLTLKIKEMEKEITMSTAEIENYKKSIDNLKNKLEFKINLEKALNLENILKGEILKNKEIKKEYDSLAKVNTVQVRALNSYDKENRISEKMDILKTEIKQTKDSLKDFQEKHSKQDKYLKGVHERLSNLENLTKKIVVTKMEIRKSFSREDLKSVLEALERTKNQIKESKKLLVNSKKQNEDKLNSFVLLNKKIESDFKESDKMNKMLIFKKNELKRLIKTNNNNLESRLDKMENKNTKKIIQNGDISHLYPSKKKNIKLEKNENSRGEETMRDRESISNTNLPIIADKSRMDSSSKPKLFSKNPNRERIEFPNDEEEADQPYEEESEENSDFEEMPIELGRHVENHPSHENQLDTLTLREHESPVNRQSDLNLVQNFQIEYV